MLSFFRDLVDPFAPYAHRNVPAKTLRGFIWSFAGPLKRAIIVGLILSIIVAIVEIGVLQYLGGLVDRMTNTDPADMWREHGLWLLGLGLFIVVIRPLLQFAQMALVFISIGGNAATVVRWRSHRHVARQSIGWFENDFAGRIANRISQTPSAVEEVIFLSIEALTYAGTYALASLVMMGAVHWQLLIPMVLWLAAYGGLLWLAVGQVTPASEAYSKARSQFTGRIVDGYSNVHSVKMFAHHDREEAYVREAIEEARDAQMQEMTVYTKLEGALVFLNGLLVVSVVGWALYLWSGGITTIGVVAAATALVLRLNAMTGWIMWAVTNLFSNIGVVKEGMETIAQPITLLDASNATPLQVIDAGIEIRDLTHHYGRGSGGLDGISLSVKPGEKIGLIGRSGAGKSTLVKLLLRFYDHEGGQILIDDQSISDVTQESLRRAIGMVQQDNALLHRSIRDNIAYGRPDATDDQIADAARRAHAHDFIPNLQDTEGRTGYDALVGERGVKLSGGQRQRIALARVILKDAPILVLDEATSALDSEVEAAIQDTLYTMMEGKTVIAIAHRLSTIARMDRIVVMDQGRIVEDGTHDELLTKGGIYAQLWSHQSGGFIE